MLSFIDMTTEVTTQPTVSKSVARTARAFAWAAAAVWWLLAIGSGLAVVVLAAVAVRSGRTRVSLPVTFTARDAALSGLSGTITIPVRPVLVMAALAAVVAGVLLVLVVIWQVRGLLTALAAGRPFTARSARRIRIIAVVVGTAELARAAGVWAAGSWLGGHVQAGDLAVSATFAPSWEVLALAVLLWLLAEVFGMGTRLQHDNDLTI
jgi:hypothetical protein